MEHYSTEDSSILLSNSIKRSLRLFLLILSVTFVAEWGSSLFCTYVLHAHYPSTTPLFDPGVRFSDWSNLLLRASHFGQPGMQTDPALGLPYPYPVPTLYVFILFIHLFAHPTRAFVGTAILIFVVAALLFSIYLQRLHAPHLFSITVWAALLLGSPAVFLIDRGNIEVFVWLFVLFGLLAFVRNHPCSAAFLFAIAACMKFYPVLYLLLFLPRRQYKALTLGISATVAVSLFALAGIGPSISAAIHGMAPGVAFMRDVQANVVNEGILRFDHSLLALGKQTIYTVLIFLHPADASHEPAFVKSVLVYSFTAPLIFAALYLFRIRRLPLFNQFAAITICSLLFPYVSYEYTLVHVYLVFSVFLLFLLQDVMPGFIHLHRRLLTMFVICFAVVFSYIAILAFDRFTGQVKSLALIVLLILFLRYPLPSTLFSDSPAR